MQRPLVVQVQLLERLANLALPTPCSRPQTDQHRVRARRAIEGVPTQRSTSDSGANARKQLALWCQLACQYGHAYWHACTVLVVTLQLHRPLYALVTLTGNRTDTQGDCACFTQLASTLLGLT